MAGHLPFFEPVQDVYRHRQAEYVRHPLMRGWFQDGRKLRNIKASKAFIWPKDGKNGTKWGRMKDVLLNRGPDIFVAFGADKGDCVSNRPTRAQWSGHVNLDDRGLAHSFNERKFAPWTTDGLFGGRMPGLSYDFRTRKHCIPHRRMWTDVRWQSEPRRDRSNPYPEAVRMSDGRWYQDYEYMPQFLGGDVHNERGWGLDGFHLPHGS
ncbi:hypothetical protein BKA66DRAFT_419826 [Pyrenochaeta sp. MPI-SDFR-AT-0127]|nr:hypothetical protein BKA66DRAFT_419826 [Pyrenochaeta sp. MPI-SDFR-AT-0127]